MNPSHIVSPQSEKSVLDQANIKYGGGSELVEEREGEKHRKCEEGERERESKGGVGADKTTGKTRERRDDI